MASMWKRTLHFLGLVEDYDDEYADLPEEQGAARPAEAAPPRPEPSNVRRIPPARQEPAVAPAGAWSPPPPGQVLTEARPEAEPTAALRPVGGPSVHVTNPTTFNQVEEVGERFRSGVPVIMNLAGAGEPIAKRLLDFASGLIYGLDGRIERVGDRVFLLTPRGVDVSTEERARLRERGFFNQD